MEQGSSNRPSEKAARPRKRGYVCPEENSNLSIPHNNSQQNHFNETILHTALDNISAGSDERKNLNQIIENNPEKITYPRTGDFEGQLPLHMAVCHGDTQLVDSLLRPLLDEQKMECLHSKATGKAFTSNVMGAELPLSVATLTGNKTMVEHLLRYGTRPTETNSKGENVLHSIISYAYMYPEKADLMLDMMTFLMDKSTVMKELSQKNPDENIRWKMFLIENNRGKNPLQVALQLGQLEIFKYILQTAYVINHGNGLFGIEKYDVTDVDMSMTLVPEKPDRRRNGETDPFPLDHLISLNIKTAMTFLNYLPISRLIRQRWYGYRKLFWITFFIHSVLMIMLTVAAVFRAERKPVGGVITDVNEINNATNAMPTHVFSIPAEGRSDTFTIIAGFISLPLAVLYISQEIWRLYKGRLQLQMKHIFHPFSNNMFRLQIFIFGLSLVADFIATWFSVYDEDFALLLAIIIGWFLFLFFLRAMRRFCQFTSLAQRAMFDIMRFSVIIFIELVAFTTVMYALIRGSKLDTDEDGREFQETWIQALFLVFQQIFGIGDLPLFKIRNRVIVNIVYICFIVTTTVLMLNALIAIMSNTCTELFNSNDGSAHLRFHQYSIIRFFESILPDRCVMLKARQKLEEVEKLRFDPKENKMTQQKRFLLFVDSLRSISNDSVTNSPESTNTQLNNSTNRMTEKSLDLTHEQNMTKTDSIEIHHLRMGLCDKCLSKYSLPIKEPNKTYDLMVKCKF